jgi:DNA end-binding protein Ku
LAPRASWKGFLKIAEVTCPVALYAAASTTERIALHTINRRTGNRIQREFVDAETGETVERDDQVKGYEVGKDEYVSLEPEEIAAVIPHGDRTLTVSAFIDLAEADDLYFDKPYYLAPSDRSGDETFTLLREGMLAAKAAAIAEAALFRRVRTLLIRPDGKGLAATTLNFDYEVRSAQEAFSAVPAKKISREMLDLAIHIIKTKAGAFDPRAVHDRYEGALADLVKLKLEGKPIPKRAEPQKEAIVSLMQALRDSARAGGKASGKSRAGKAAGGGAGATAKAAAPRRKAG